MINGCKIGCCLSTLYSLFTLYKLVDEYVDSAICLLIIGLIIIIIIIFNNYYIILLRVKIITTTITTTTIIIIITIMTDTDSSNRGR